VGLVLTKADELGRMNLELRRRNEELAAFAYASSHDLKEPLRGIYNYSSILLEDYESRLDEEGKDYLNGILEMSQRMERLINELLRIAQLRQAELRLNPVDLNQCLQQAYDVIQASRPDIKFQLIKVNKLPTTECDSVMIGEVFRNLISNGIKYNNSENILIEVGFLDLADADLSHLVHPESSEKSPVIYVRDNGIGIKENHFKSVFNLFKRLHPQDRFGGGVGAGLAIVKQIIERHSGSIWIESTLGEGSTFFFTLK
jgi:chemotaxis family two-component system sensor kinase Cph1